MCGSSRDKFFNKQARVKAPIWFVILVSLIFSVSCGDDWYYTDLVVQNLIEVPSFITATVEGKTTTIKKGQTLKIYTLEPTKDEAEASLTYVVFEIGTAKLTANYELRTKSGEPGQVLIKVMQVGDEYVFERHNIIYEE